MNNEKYYVRVAFSDCAAFETHLKIHNVLFESLSRDFTADPTVLYSVSMDSETALSLKLSFPLKGCMNFNKTLGRLISTSQRETND